MSRSRKRVGAAPAQRRRIEPPELIGDRAAAVRHDDLQLRKVLEHIRVEQAEDRDRALVDEMHRIARALGAGARGVDMRRDVELAQLLVERIPVAVAERRRFLPGVLVRIGIEQAADEAELLDAAFELRQRLLDRRAGGLRQARDAEELVRIESGSGDE